MAGSIKTEYRDLKAAKASLNERIGWITRTSRDIKGAIAAFNCKKNDRNAAKLESLADDIDIRWDSLQQCGDWIQAHDDDEVKDTSDKIEKAHNLVEEAKKNDTDCLKEHTYTAVAPVRVSPDKRQI